MFPSSKTEHAEINLRFTPFLHSKVPIMRAHIDILQGFQARLKETFLIFEGKGFLKQ
jgi:hypothetical protein